jgi:epoxyqueuosine reductase QueG
MSLDPAALRRQLLSDGASDIGFADLCPLDASAWPSAISILVALDPRALTGIVDSPDDAYHREYGRANDRLAALAGTAEASLVEAGYRAAALPPTTEAYDPATLSAPFPHKTAATLAGLGWIGRSALLVTPSWGAAIRLATVLTDAPLPPGLAPVTRSGCGSCRQCVAACPGGAITGAAWHAGMPREALVDAAACERTARRLARRAGIPATICGVCVVRCTRTMGRTVPAGRERPGRDRG